MVAAAVAWVRAARPNLTPDQVSQAIRLSAVDLGAAGLGPEHRLRPADRSRGALTITPPPADPAEPNDDIVWVDGRAFGKPDRLFYKGKGHRRLQGLLDAAEDPADVYRIRIRGALARADHARTRPATTTSPCTSTGARPSGCGQQAVQEGVAQAARQDGAHHAAQHRQAARRPTTWRSEVQPGARDLDAGYALRVG